MEKAKWIWQNNLNTPDEYVRFSDSFDCGSAEEITIDISSDSNYALYLNGELTAFSQYADYPHYKVFDRLTMKEHLRRGVNRLEIVVWYLGDGCFTYTPGSAGLIYEVKAGGETLAYSGTHTQCVLALDYLAYQKKFITWQLGYSFKYDTRYADHLEGYGNAVEASGITYDLHPRPVKRLELRPLVSGILIDKEKQIYDLGCERVGFLQIKFKAACGALVTVSFSEHIADGFVPRLIGHRDFSVELIGSGQTAEYLNPFRRLGCRYLQIECESGCEIESIGICETIYPLKRVPFQAKTPLMQRIYDVSVRTLELCMHEHYEDCPWREQALYTMDSRNQMLCGYYAFKEYEFPRANLLLMSKGQKSDKLLSLCFPAGIDNPIPFFSLIYLMQMKEYAEYSGDSSLLREKLGLLEDIVGVFMARIESNGLASNFKGYWNFYEWSQGLDDVVDGHCGNRERYVKSYDLPLNCHLILALENLDGIYAILGMPRRNQKAIESLRAAVHKAFYVESEGLFKSFGEGAHYSKYCNSLAVLSGCGFGHEKEICERIVTDGGMMTEVTLSKKVFEYDALLKIDWKYSEFVLSDIEKNYSYMLGRGATSFWETILGHTDFDNAGSLCHGWSAIPVYYMHILK